VRYVRLTLSCVPFVNVRRWSPELSGSIAPRLAPGKGQLNIIVVESAQLPTGN